MQRLGAGENSLWVEDIEVRGLEATWTVSTGGSLFILFLERQE